MEYTLPMSLQKLNHLDILRRSERSEITQQRASELLMVTDRTIRRQLKRLKKDGPSFLQHGLKGRTSNNRIPLVKEQKIAELLLTKYPDFGPTFATEKLQDLHHIVCDTKTVRRIQIQLKLYTPRKNKKQSTHRFWRVRRSIYGELAQFDGSYHNWFEGRNSNTESCLLLANDDATGDILDAQFAEHEGVLPVMEFWLSYAGINGIPKAVYLDRFSTYSMNMKLAAENPDTLTQFERAARDVGMQVIHAHSPQAKGRVENIFGTLQDRLVKELRLHNICTVGAANIYLRKIFIPAYNRKFRKPAILPGDLHRKPTKRELTEILPYIFCRKETRVIQNDFTIPYKTNWFQLLPTPKLAMRPKERVDVHELPDGSIYFTVRGKKANFHILKDRINKKQASACLKTLTT